MPRAPKKPFVPSAVVLSPLSAAALDAVSGGVNMRNISVTIPQMSLDSPGAISAEYAADLQAAQYLHRDPSLDVVTYDGTGPGNRFVMGAYTRENFNDDLHAGNFVVRNDEVVSNAPGSVNDRFSGLENPPTVPFSPEASDGHASFDDRFNAASSGPSWLQDAQAYDSHGSNGSFSGWPDASGSGATRSIDDGGHSGTGAEDGAFGSSDHFDDGSNASGPTQTFDDGSSLTTFDDGSTLAQDTDGNFSSSPSFDDGGSFDGGSFDGGAE